MLLLLTVLAVWIFSRIIDRQRGKKRVVAAYSVSLALLAIFILLRFMEPLEINVLDIDYPFGASVWLLCAISCIFDVERGDAPPPTAVEAVAYLAYFPLMVAGPIVKYRDGVTMLGHIEFSFAKAARGAEHFMLGFIKRFAVSSVLFRMIETLSANVEKGIGIIAVFEFIIIVPLAAYAYFSGYSDMGIGVSLILGLTPPENFKKPLASASPIEYAKRFMSSLYEFASDYIGYIHPSRKSGRGSAVLANTSVFFFIFFWFEPDPIKLCLLLPAALLLGILSCREPKRRSRAASVLSWGGTFLLTSLFWGFIMLEDAGKAIPLAIGIFSNFRVGGSLLAYGVSMSKYLLSAVVTALIIAVFDRVVRGDTGTLSEKSLPAVRMAVNVALISMFVFTLLFYFPQYPNAAMI